MIPYGKQDISDEDIRAVIGVLESDFLTQGPAVPAFEKTVAEHCRAAHAIAVCNATAALHIACLALGVGPGDRVWTSPVTFVASANCALYCGAEVVFVDIDPRTYNLCPQKLRKKLEEAKQSGTLPKVVIPVHLCGQSCDMRAIRELGKEFGFSIIEDASHAVGGEYLSRPVGSCEWSDITVLSFHPVKIVTTGEGGMALTNDAALAKSMALLRSHGITRDVELMTSEPEGAWYYEQIILGFNYRMTDIQAALGNSQMSRLKEFVNVREQIGDRYDRELTDLPLILPWQHPDTRSARHLYVIRLDTSRVKKSHRQVFDELRSAGIGVNLHYMPVYRQPYFRANGFENTMLPEAEAYYFSAISIPIYPGLLGENQTVVINALTSILSE